MEAVWKLDFAFRQWPGWPHCILSLQPPSWVNNTLVVCSTHFLCNAARHSTLMHLWLTHVSASVQSSVLYLGFSKCGTDSLISAVLNEKHHRIDRQGVRQPAQPIAGIWLYIIWVLLKKHEAKMHTVGRGLVSHHMGTITLIGSFLLLTGAHMTESIFPALL